MGRPLTLDGVSYQVVGVMPESFCYPFRDAEPYTLLGVAALVTWAALLACFLPARSAATVDASRTLRSD